MRRALLLLLLAGCEDPGGIVATVRDGAGNPVADVTVLAHIDGAERPSAATTDKDGIARWPEADASKRARLVVRRYRGAELLGGPDAVVAPDARTRRVEFRFDPPRGRVVTYRIECPDPPELPAYLAFHAVGSDLGGGLDVAALPCEVSVLVPVDCPPLRFGLDFMDERYALDARPSDGPDRKVLRLRPVDRIAFRVRDKDGEAFPPDGYHVRVWYLENGDTRSYPRESDPVAGKPGVHAVTSPWPLELLEFDRFSLRFEVRAGPGRSECYPLMPAPPQADLDLEGPEVLRRLRERGAIEIAAPIARAPEIAVRDAAGRPVAGVKLVLIGSDDPETGETRTVGEAVSDAEGLVRFGKVDELPQVVVADTPFYGVRWTAGGVRGDAPMTVFRERDVTFHLAHASTDRTEVDFSGVLPGLVHWSADGKPDDRGDVTVAVPHDLESIEVAIPGQRATVALERDQVHARVAFLPSVHVAVRSEGERIEVLDPATGEAVDVSTFRSSGEPGVQRTTLPARPLRIVASKDGRVGRFDWDGKAAEVVIDLRPPVRHALRLVFVDDAGAPLPGLAFTADWNGEGDGDSFAGTTAADGSHVVEVVEGWVYVWNVQAQGRAGGEAKRVQVEADTTHEVRMRTVQYVHVETARPLHRVKWRRDGGPWQETWARRGDAAYVVPVFPGARPGRIVLEIDGTVLRFDYTGRPGPPPVFELD